MKLYCELCKEYSEFSWNNQDTCDLCINGKVSKTNRIRKLLEEDYYAYATTDSMGELLDKIKEILDE